LAQIEGVEMEETADSETPSSQGINIIQNIVRPTVLFTFNYQNLIRRYGSQVKWRLSLPLSHI